MSDVALHVDGREYRGWESVVVRRSLEQAAGSFALKVSEHWSGQGEAWPIRQEDRCKVSIDGEVVIDGYVDVVDIDLSGSSRNVSVRGSDAAASLATCSADLESWTFRRATVLQIAQRVAAPYGIDVSSDVSDLPTIDKIVVNPGDSPFDAIEQAARTAGVLVVSDGAGGLLLTRAASERAGDGLAEGYNILAVKATYDATHRYRRYVVMAQQPGSDGSSGNALRVNAEATDEGVKRTERVKVIRSQKSETLASAKRRADWAARIGAARSERAVVTVQGWRQRSGGLWRPNLVVSISALSARINGDVLISGVEYSLGDGGELARLDLVRPDAYIPEPVAAKVRTRGGWPDVIDAALARGTS
jgi:prophage tail gpP-like protein